MYIMGTTGDIIRQYDLLEPWTVATAGHAPRFPFTQEATPEGFCFSNDGKFLYITGITSDQIHRYALTTNWDVSRQVTFLDSSINYGTASGILETSPTSVFFKPDGLGFFIIGSTTDTVFERSVTVPWTFQGEAAITSFSVAAQETIPKGITFSTDGTRMFIIGTSSDRVNQYNLTTAWTLASGVVFSGNFLVSAQDITPEGVEFSTDGTRMFVIGTATNRIYQYILSTPWNVTTAIYDNKSYLLTQLEGLSSWQEVRFKSDGSQMYVITVSDIVFQLELVTPWDISTVVYQLKTLNVNPFDSAPNLLEFNNDGTKLYVGGQTNDIINELNLSTPWEVTTAVFGNFLNLSSQNITVGGINFNSDGTKFFAVATNQGSIYSYNLSTPWQVRTATLDQTNIFPLINNLLTLKFDTSGTNLYVIGQNTISHFQLTVAWDISTRIELSTLDVIDQAKFLTDGSFKSDGSVLYLITRSRKILIYNLTINWDLSTAVFESFFDISSETNIPSGIAFKNDGERMYLVDQESTTIYVYDFKTPWDINNLSSDRGKLFWSFQAREIVSDQVINLFTWKHVAVSKNYGKLRLFIDGNLISELDDTFNYSPTGEFRIGRGPSTSTDYFNGLISNFRLTIGDVKYTTTFDLSSRPLASEKYTNLLTANSSVSTLDTGTKNLTVFRNGLVNPISRVPFEQTSIAASRLITYGGGGGNSGQNSQLSRAGGIAGGSGGGGQGETPWSNATAYRASIGGETLHASSSGYVSYSFDVDSRLVIGNNSLFDFGNNVDYTIETWFFIEGNSPLNAASLRRACIISAQGEAAVSSTSFEFLINGNSAITGTGFVINIRNTSTTPTIYTFPATITQYEWNHVAFSKHDNIMSVYLNGTLIGEASNFTMQTIPGSNPVKIASVFSSGTTFQPFIGRFSNLRISRGIARYKTPEFQLPTAPYIDDEYTILLTCQGENYKDSSKNQLTLTREGAVVINNSNTPFSKKRLFSGSFKNSAYLRADFAVSSFTSPTQPWTLECWINEAQLQAGDGFFIAFNTIAAGGNILLIRRDAITVGSTNFTFSQALDRGQWNHFAITYSGSVIRVFKNGQLVLNQATALSALYLCNLGIGTEFDDPDGGTPGNYYIGYIHDLRIVNYVVYTDNFIPPSDLLENIPGTTLLCLRNERFTDDSSNRTPILIFNNPRMENISPYNTDRVIPFTKTTAIADSRYGSMVFNGTTDFIDVASNFSYGTGNFTIEFWCKFTTTSTDGGGRRILSQGGNAANQIQVYVVFSNTVINGSTAVRGSISLFTTADQISTVRAVSDGKWHHIAFTRASGTLRCFVDGELVDTRTGFTTNLNSTLGYRIGTFATSATTANYAGSLANIRISSNLAWYTSSFTPLLDNFNIDYNNLDFRSDIKILIQGSTIEDLSFNFYEAIVNGSTLVLEDSPFQQFFATVLPLKNIIKSYGSNGGFSIPDTTAQIGGGGGGGADLPGFNTNSNTGGAGGDGKYIPSFDSYYAGGGGGGNNDVLTTVSGGLGGGGLGGASLDLGYHNAIVNTGGGGGGSAFISPTFTSGGNGGSGIIKIKYKSKLPIAKKITDIVSSPFRTLNIAPIIAQGLSTYTYQITPKLPEGLSFSTTTGVISGSTQEIIDQIYTIVVRDTVSNFLDSNTFRLTISQLKIAGGEEFTITEGSNVFKVHKFNQSGTIDFEKIGIVDYFLLGGGGAGGGGLGSADGCGGGGAGGYVTGTTLISPNTLTSIKIHADSSSQNQGWTENSDFAGETGQASFFQLGQTQKLYRVHIFKDSNTFTVPNNIIVDYLIVAGGGSGGNFGVTGSAAGGGGGAGGLIYKTTQGLTANTYTVIVGAGASATSLINSYISGNGSDSSFNNEIAVGGGGAERSGGSGGGGGAGSVGSSAGSPGTFSQGKSGGAGSVSRKAGGGGGAGEVGGAATSTISGNGGNGLTFDITGSDVYYAGGGGGGADIGRTIGGLGGGGAGGNSGVDPIENGIQNTGGGGGGCNNSGTSSFIAGLGGSGIVVIRYQINSEEQILAQGGETFVYYENIRKTVGGARSNILPDIKYYLEIKINQQDNVNIGICKSSSFGGFFNCPSINLETGELQGSATGKTTLGKFNIGDTLQILYDNVNSLVYFGKNNIWSKNYLQFGGDFVKDSGDTQIIVLPNNKFIDSSLSIEFKQRESYIFSSPDGFISLGGTIAEVPIIIGAGGAGVTTTGNNGGDTVFSNITALGGGGGGSFTILGRSGGCGGGGGGRNSAAGGGTTQILLGYGAGSDGGAAAPTTVAGTNAGGGGGSINFNRVITSKVAVGGNESIINVNGQLYRVHVFNNSSVFYVNANISAECLIVGGGGATHQGGDGNAGNGGGGAGGLLHITNLNFSADSEYIMFVGAGASSGSNGNNSKITGNLNGIETEIVALGGGKGGGFKQVGNIGGSGGGGGGRILTLGGTGTPGQGNRGGRARSNDTPGNSAGGGGGGAGTVGGDGNTANIGGAGGNGLEFDITGTATYYAGGGGAQGSDGGGLGGLGGGGNGGLGSGAATNGSLNTGGGGGGRRDTALGGSGGSGVIIVKYPIPTNEELNSFTLDIVATGAGQNAGLGLGGAGGPGGIRLFDEFIYGAGGGGSGQTTSGAGGSIFAGQGASSSTLTGVLNAVENTGSGGGGAWNSTSNSGLGGNGGSGVAFIRYRIK